MAGFEIRPIEEEDAARVWSIAQEFLRDTRYGTVTPLDKERFVQDFFTYVDDDNHAGWLSTDEKGGVEAILLAQVERVQFSNVLMSCDNAIYVTPKKRGAALSKRMILKYKDWALAKGVAPEHLQIGVLTGVTTERTTSFFEKIGFVRTGNILTWGESTNG